MTPEQQRFIEAIPATAGARLAALNRELTAIEDGGDRVVEANWTFYQALNVEWDRTRAAVEADRKAQEIGAAARRVDSKSASA